MKTKYFILTLAVAAVSLVSCHKEQQAVNVPEPARKGTFNFSSSTGEVTKVTLNADNSLFWAAGDKIAVYNYKGDDLVQSDVANLTGGEGTAVGTFTPATDTENTNWFIDGDADDQAYTFAAFYPGSLETPASKVVGISAVAASQKQSDGIGKYIVSWASANTTKAALAGDAAPSFAFAPKSALLKLTIRNNGSVAARIASITLTAASGNLAGSASLNLGTGVLSGGSSASITYTPSAPIELAAGAVTSAPILVSMLPGTPGTISVSIANAGVVSTVSSISLATVESGHVYAKEVAISGITRELAISNGNSGANLANSAALDADPLLYYGGANCIVMGAEDTRAIVNISLYKATASTYLRSAGSASPKITAVKKAKVIWAEEDLYYDPAFAIVSGNTTQLIIQKSAGVTGNALIGIYDESDKLLWSYHIWCPIDRSVVSATSEDASPATYQVYKLALGQVLGADSDTYMYYQWGRKDPLGRAVNSFAGNSLIAMYGDAPSTAAAKQVVYKDTEETTNNLGYARRNPTVYIKDGNEAPYDWFPANAIAAARTADNAPNGQNDNLWNSSKNTIFDPCPQGYHVAPKKLWAGTADKAEGPLFSSAGLWYVLGGYRSRTVANVSHVSSNGYCWSSEVVGGANVSAYHLGFNSGTDLGRASQYSRASGFGVRCARN